MFSPSTSSTWTVAIGAIQVLILCVTVAEAQQDPCAIFSSRQRSSLGDKVLQHPYDIIYDGGVDAEITFQCATSVPIFADQATFMVESMKNYTGLLSTLPYLKNPPASYQQPGVDVMARLDEIGNKARNHEYNNMYEFQLDIYNLQASTHEGHFGFAFGTSGLFVWWLPDQIVSVSSDGQELPQIFAYSDILGKVPNASPIIEIGGLPVFEYLRNFIETKTSNGMLEAHGDFNAMIPSDARQFAEIGMTPASSYSFPLFTSSYVYNGKSLQGHFANGTAFEWKYTGGSGENFSENGWTSGMDIYKGRVLKPPPSSSNSKRDAKEEYEDQLSKKRDSVTGRVSPIYPPPDLFQEYFGFGSVGSAYFLRNESIAILSLPSFNIKETTNVTIQSYSALFNGFLTQAKSAGMKKLVIDLQGNGGGVLSLGYDLFIRLFPNKVPNDQYFRLRQFPASDTWGKVISTVRMNPQSFPPWIVSEVSKKAKAWPFDLTNSVQLDGTIWTSWDSFYEGERFDGEEWTQPTGSNLYLSNPDLPNSQNLDFDAEFAIPLPFTEPPFAAEDIILLTDGVCASTCHTFSMFMKNDAGVKSVVVGGLPEYGPMQAVAGTRGGIVNDWNYYSEMKVILLEIVNNLTPEELIAFTNAVGITMDDIQALPPLVTNMPWNIGQSSINGMNVVHRDSPQVTRQFVYEAADCRLFCTADMYHDITHLWRAAAQFAGGDKSVCVRGSTDGPGTEINNTLLDSPGFSYNSTWDNVNSTSVPKSNRSDSATQRYGISMIAILVSVILAVL
ncbi:unnamed protein product [Clonostachys rhizophaga]|uniref:Tail specific protease domain-containing protein n=1 Tax=Clonostachys rhizophaga TaxID=160324 RepID=A0A9N9W0L0_9HYPO|nr:unnamed protein product [Clonostachys rhizophaga]